MSALDLNDDCWTTLLAFLAHISIDELLKCGTLNRRFKNLVDTHPLWTFVGKTLKIEPPKPRASGNETWKSLILQMGGTFCERCFQHMAPGGLGELHRFSYRQPVVLVCYGCGYTHKQQQEELFRRRRKERLLREIGNLPIFQGCNSARIFEADIAHMPGKVTSWLHDGPDINLAPKMALEFGALAGRRAVVKEMCAELSQRSEIQTWVLTGVGNIQQIAQYIRDRGNRQEEVNRRFPELADEFKVEWWVDCGLGDIGQIVHTLQQQKGRKRDLESKLNVFGLRSSMDSYVCETHINDGIGDVDEIVTGMREMDWFRRCTRYESLRYVENTGSYHGRGRGVHIDVEVGKKLALDQWVQTSLRQYTEAKTVADICQHLQPSEIPPQFLHAKLEERIRSTSNVAAQQATTSHR
ncbi:hypothetical protein HK097_010194 [Rhizophlyctis rosea]|uniref:F-box domain-containing protein n=1 Tax=Rhizophlyctis rosea TaxID=64517 RepID=A0AAD5S7X8_9FUNG|nr:hypothetical protein HK097_010194 [Rhizophlyctis rosea]